MERRESFCGVSSTHFIKNTCKIKGNKDRIYPQKCHILLQLHQLVNKRQNVSKQDVMQHFTLFCNIIISVFAVVRFWHGVLMFEEYKSYHALWQIAPHKMSYTDTWAGTIMCALVVAGSTELFKQQKSAPSWSLLSPPCMSLHSHWWRESQPSVPSIELHKAAFCPAGLDLWAVSQ